MKRSIQRGIQRGIAFLGAVLLMIQSPMGVVASYGQNSVSENSVSGNNISENSVSQNEVKGYQEDESNLLLNYVYLENADLNPGEVQNFMVSLGEDEVQLEEGTLSLVHEENGEEVKITSSEISGNVMKFSADTTGWKTGIYRVKEVTYLRLDGEVHKKGRLQLSLIQDMENICFGLGVDSPYFENQFVEYDTEGNPDRNTLTEEVPFDELQENEEQIREMVSDSLVTVESPEESDKVVDKIVEMIEEAVPDRRVAGSLVVMLDPGHDNTHAGARANGLEEEKLTLKVAEYCKEYLDDNYSDVVVYMTRSSACPHPGTDSGDCNLHRVIGAAQKKADVYVSLHFNSTASSSTTATGAMVFYPNSNYNGNVGSQGAVLAAKIIEQLAKLGLHNNGIKIRNSESKDTYEDGSLADYYGVIRNCKKYGIPAVIVEHAFLNNAADAAFLKDEANLKALGVADAKGIAQAYKLSTAEVEYDAEDLKITEIDGVNGTFKMTVTGATPVKRIADLELKVYPMEDKSKVYTYKAELKEKSTGTYSVTGNVSNHGKKTGKYKVIAYAVNAAGKKTQLRSATFTIEKTKLNRDEISFKSKVSSKEGKVTLYLDGNKNAATVSFKVYGEDGGSKDAKTYPATLNSKGQWVATVKVSDHKEMGDYAVAVYSKSYFGNKNKVASGTFRIKGPSVKSVKVINQKLTKGTFRIKVDGATSKSGVKKVSLIVRNLDGTKVKNTYTAKKAKSGYYYYDIDMKNFKYQYGRYQIKVQVLDKNGIDEVVKTYTHNVKKPTPKVTAKIVGKQTKVKIKASDLGIAASVKGVRFRVYPVSAPSLKKTYDAKKGSSGTYSKSVEISDFGKSGEYKILTYVKGVNGKYKRVGKPKTFTVAGVTGGKVKAKKISDSSMYLSVSDMNYKGKIKQVQIKVWPKSNSKAKYTYTATHRPNGSYRAKITSSKHKGIGGDYKYQVIVTAKNGIKKTLLKGTVTLGESTPESSELYSISGDSNATVSQMMAYYKKFATYPAYYAGTDAPTLKKFCQYYYNECEKEGIRAEVAFAQAMKETNFLRYGGDVKISQFNFAGIGAVGGGAGGASFANVRTGIRGHVQHLKAYANTEPLNDTCVDPRFDLVTRGCAPYVEWLGISTNPYGKGWATDPTYSASLRKMIDMLLDF